MIDFKIDLKYDDIRTDIAEKILLMLLNKTLNKANAGEVVIAPLAISFEEMAEFLKIPANKVPVEIDGYIIEIMKSTVIVAESPDKGIRCNYLEFCKYEGDKLIVKVGTAIAPYLSTIVDNYNKFPHLYKLMGNTVLVNKVQ